MTYLGILYPSCGYWRLNLFSPNLKWLESAIPMFKKLFQVRALTLPITSKVFAPFTAIFFMRLQFSVVSRKAIKIVAFSNKKSQKCYKLDTHFLFTYLNNEFYLFLRHVPGLEMFRCDHSTHMEQNFLYAKQSNLFWLIYFIF